ncbi:unnamed protein product [Tuber aestivum]|uniref:Uncharacterized protein n=1 Tax=Tuber aestivum TaxID=59557 RepID=A0A292PSF5_9PEZI|nr:unnamed protein product [Tuber aestivum]
MWRMMKTTCDVRLAYTRGSSSLKESDPHKHPAQQLRDESTKKGDHTTQQEKCLIQSQCGSILFAAIGVGIVWQANNIRSGIDRVESRLDSVESRLDSLESSVESKFNSIKFRLNRVESSVESRFDSIEHTQLVLVHTIRAMAEGHPGQKEPLDELIANLQRCAKSGDEHCNAVEDTAEGYGEEN